MLVLKQYLDGVVTGECDRSGWGEGRNRNALHHEFAVLLALPELAANHPPLVTSTVTALSHE